MYHGGNVTPDVKILTSQMALTAIATGAPATLHLVDLLLYYPGINLNSNALQNLVNGSGLTRYTGGKGVRAFFEATVASGATAHNVAMTYTDDAGNAGNALPGTVAGVASSPAGSIIHSGTAANNTGPFLPLAQGDGGVRSVQSVQLSAASGAGTGALVLCKPLAKIPLIAANVAVERNQVLDLMGPEIIQDGACLAILVTAGAATAANSLYIGSTEFVWG
jgi:hypothetical protein